MPYPREKVHRVSRRRLGRGQYPRPVPVTAAVMGFGTTITIVFSRPVTVAGTINFSIPPAAPLSQTIDSATQVTLTYNQIINNLPWVLPTPPANVKSRDGAPILGETGDFLLNPDDILDTAGGNYFPPPAAEVAAAFQFGIGNTSETGSYVTPTPPNSNPIAAVNNGDGTYTITFAFAVQTQNAGPNDPMILMYDSFANVWNEASPQENSTGAVHVFRDATSSTTNTIFAIMPGVASLIPGANPFALPASITIP